MEKDLGFRRVQRTGRGSYIISLPKKWVEDIGLEKGSEVAFLLQSDSSLTLVPRKSFDREKRSDGELKEYELLIEQGEDPKSVCRKIISLYVISADLIHIRFKGRNHSKYKMAIKGLARNMLLGSEIIEETPEDITLQILVNHLQFPVEKAIRRMSVLALSANEDAVLALKEMDQGLIQDVKALHDDVNRLSLYAIRQLKFGLEQDLFRELGFKTPKEFLGYRIVVNDIKSISNNAMNTANNIMTLKKLIRDQTLFLRELVDEELYTQILNFNSSAHSFFEKSLKALFKRDYEQADKIISQLTPLLSLESNLIILMSSKKLDPNISSILRVILENSRRIVEYTRDIAEVTLNRAIDEVNSIQLLNKS